MQIRETLCQVGPQQGEVPLANPETQGIDPGGDLEKNQPERRHVVGPAERVIRGRGHVHVA
jgi:hypothetical protein